MSGSNKLNTCAPTGRTRSASLLASPGHVRAFKALAHQHRLRVFLHLVQAGGPVAAQDLLKAVRIPGPTLSHHLDHLERAGLIVRRRQERFILSHVRAKTVLELVRLLTACC